MQPDGTSTIMEAKKETLSDTNQPLHKTAKPRRPTTWWKKMQYAIQSLFQGYSPYHMVQERHKNSTFIGGMGLKKSTAVSKATVIKRQTIYAFQAPRRDKKNVQLVTQNKPEKKLRSKRLNASASPAAKSRLKRSSRLLQSSKNASNGRGR